MSPAALRFRTLLGGRVDGASLAVFRIGFSLVMLVEIVRYVGHGWIANYWITPRFHFTYYFFEWLRPLPSYGMYGLFALMAISACCMALGLWYRYAASFFFVAFAYQFLLEQARYLNHFYAACLFAALLAVTPAAATWSLRRGAGAGDGPEAGTVPVWALWILRCQVIVIYTFAGVAKLNDDWIGGASWRNLMEHRSATPFAAYLLAHDHHGLVMGYGALCFDLLICPAILWRRTRVPAFMAAAGFHLINSQLFSIGIFPWMMIVATTLLLPPSWPRAVLGYLWPSLAGPHGAAAHRNAPVGWPIAAALTIYLLLQVAVPLRHHLYDGDVAWTEEGHRFSWRMMLRSKDGFATFSVVTDTGTRVVIPTDYLTTWQVQMMNARPDMILQFAHFLADEEEGRSGRRPAVHAEVYAALDGRPMQQLIDPAVDLAAIPRTLSHASWVRPLPGQPRLAAGP